MLVEKARNRELKPTVVFFSSFCLTRTFPFVKRSAPLKPAMNIEVNTFLGVSRVLSLI